VKSVTVLFVKNTELDSKPMASSTATIVPSSSHLELVGKVDGFDLAINGAVHVPKEDGLISISDDR